MNKRILARIALAVLVVGTVLPSIGCQAASDLFNPDTYNFKNPEPWERNQKKKAVKPKTMKDQM